MTDTVSMTAPAAVPDPIVRTLQRLIRRARLVVLARGACAVAAAALGSVLAAMAVDASLTLFSSWPRWVMSLSALGLTALVAALALVRPLRRTYTLAGIARAIESRHPELHERISSAVELLASRDAPELRGSDDLIAALAAEACRDARDVRVRREVTLRSVRPFLAAALATAALFGAVFLAWPQQATHAWVRVIAPFQDRPNVFAYQLHVAPGDAVLASGDVLEVQVTVDNRAVRRATFYRAGAAEGDLATEMTPLPPKEPSEPPRFSLSCPPAAESFRYRIHAGDALSRYYTVTVVPRPTVRRLDVQYEYPAYAGRPAESFQDVGGALRAQAGTGGVLTATTNTPRAAAALLVNDRPAAPGRVMPAGPDASVCRFEFVLSKELQGRWAVHLVKSVGEYRFANTTDWRRIEAVPDSPPIARITRPEDLVLKLRPTDRLPISYAVGDDLGLTRAELHVEVDGRPAGPAALDLGADPNGPRRAAAGQTMLELGALNAHGAGQITFRLRALDNLPTERGGPQEGWSAVHTIQLDPAAFSYGRQVVLAEELALRDALLAALAELKASKEDSAPLRKVLQKLGEPNQAGRPEPLSEANLERIDRICRHLAAADAALRPVLPQLADGSFPAMAQRLTDLLTHHIGKAHHLAGQIKLTDRPDQRGELADETDFQIDRSIALVLEMLQELKVLAEVAARAEELAVLAERQEDLARQMQQMTNPSAEALAAAGRSTQPAATLPSLAGEPAGQGPLPTPEQWQQQQDDVADRLAEMVRQSGRAMQQELGRSRERTKDLAAEARRLSGQQSAAAELTARVAQLDKGRAELSALSRQQAALAAQATTLPAEAAPGMAKAAEDLQAGRTAEAVDRQKAAEAALTRQADQLTRQDVAAELARQAEQIARGQQALAERAARAQAQAETATAEASKATQHARQAAQQQQAQQSQLASRLARLRDCQKALAAQAAELERGVQASPATPTARATKPSTAMESAAASMTPEKIAQAAPQARQASEQSAQLAAELAADSAKAQAAATQPAAQTQTAQTQTAQTRPASPDPAALAAHAAKLSQQAARLADEQKKIDTELGELAALAAKADQAADQARQAQQRREQQAQAEEQAKAKLAELAGGQQDLHRQAAELATRAKQATPQATQAVGEHDPSSQMKQAAQALQRKQGAAATQSAEEAARKARALADALRPAGDPDGAAPDAQAARRAAADRAAELAKAQAELRKKTEQAADQLAKAADSLAADQWSRLRSEQARLAKEAAGLADRVQSRQPQADRLDTKAARAAAEAARQLDAARSAAQKATAAEAADQSGQAMGELARRLGGQSSTPPGRDANVAVTGSTGQEPRQVAGEAPPDSDAAQREALARDTAGLASRQQLLARQAKALAEQRPLEAIAPEQARIAERTSQLADDVDLIRRFADDLIPDSAARQEANQAAGHVERALGAQRQAQSALSASSPQRAEPPQRGSAASLQQAAAALDRLGQKVAELARSLPPGTEDPEAGQLTDAFEAAAQAAGSQEARDADLAARLLAELAKSAAQRAQAMGAALTAMQGQQAPGGAGERGVGLIPVSLLSEHLRRAGITVAEWGRLPGELRSQILQGVADEGPEEYLPLIKQYLAEVARRGGGPSKEPDK